MQVERKRETQAGGKCRQSDINWERDKIWNPHDVLKNASLFIVYARMGEWMSWRKTKHTQKVCQLSWIPFQFVVSILFFAPHPISFFFFFAIPSSKHTHKDTDSSSRQKSLFVQSSLSLFHTVFCFYLSALLRQVADEDEKERNTLSEWERVSIPKHKKIWKKFLKHTWVEREEERERANKSETWHFFLATRAKPN